MFLGRDGPLLLKHRLGPLEARDDGFEQPFHAERVIVNPPQEHIAGHLAIGQRPVKMLGAGFRHAQAANAVKILILDGRVPAQPRIVLLFGDEMIHDLLPGPSCQFGIGGVEVNPRQTKTDGRLAFRFVHGVDLLDRLGWDPCFESDRIAGGRVEGIPHAPGAFKFAIPLRHIQCFHFVRI